MSQILIHEYLAELSRLKKSQRRCSRKHRARSVQGPAQGLGDTYRFADHKERVITLLSRVARVSMETVRIVEALKTGPR